MGSYERYQKEKARNPIITPFLFFLDLFFAILRDTVCADSPPPLFFVIIFVLFVSEIMSVFGFLILLCTLCVV